ncbi:MAG: ferritin-like domain-containing protein [Rhodospirillaceae bacterium]|nr:ferritin-like domain-containing protein [Rhodospirillaceae bacterium]MBT4940817.1 ferritin-like domain-containing protein [Rhodospirillaceae bacterium]MBT5941518.1 ferritin-like domain-containing protein [Rhodospirillaceae bacterium]MBT7265258.1 ferritin-like domain-containing protein [Rhodospirillaceae bacterium]
MDSLLAMEATDQWSSELDIDWRLPICYPFWFRRRTYIKVISQFYHGERATQRVCQKLLSMIDDPQARAFITHQLAEEQKHEMVFARYVHRMGEIAPMEPAMEKALEGSLAWTGHPIGLIVSFHIIFEGGAVLLLDRLVRRFPCPLFRSLNAKIIADEARHIAFGKKYVRDHVAELSDLERRAIFSHVAKLWLDCAKAAESRYSWPVALVTRLGANWLAENWQRQRRQLITNGLISLSEANEIEKKLI